MSTLRQAAEQALKVLENVAMWESVGDPDRPALETITALRQALEAEQQADKPTAEVWWDGSKDCDWQLKMLVEPAAALGVRIPLYAGDYEAMPVMYVNQDGSFTVKAPNEELECEQQPAQHPLTKQRIDELIEEGVFGCNPYELVRRLEEERGVFMTRPLTEEQILDLSDPFGAFEYGDAQGHKRKEFARAIERAHGIGGEA